ncbi:MAG: protein kinase domain-containing protein [Dermatophilaceae bacterium]
MNSEQRRLAGRYVLESPIGNGGMGQVWRATDTVLGRAVAVKTIDLQRIPDQAGAERFEREARVTASLNHPNVVTVHDSGVEGDTAFLVMELLPGPSLAERMTEGPLPVEEVVEVGRQVASALDAAHGRGLVHRDIKPGNVAYADDGRVRVLDFGITQLGESTGAPALTATHTVMGTAEYLAPEQATGGRVDGRADLYALGCLLYALLAGRAPFSGPTPIATMVMHTHDPVPDLLAARPDTPMWLADLVDALLAKSPLDRPPGAAAVAAALEEHRAPATGATTTLLPAAGAPSTQRMTPAPAPVPAGPPTLPPNADEQDRRGRSSAAMWVLALLALTAVGVFAWILLTNGQGDGAESPTATTGAPSVTASVPEETQTPTETPEETPTPEETETAEATPSPSPTPTPEPTPADTTAEDARVALGELSDRLGALEADGVIDGDIARQLDSQVEDIERALRRDDADRVRQRAVALREDYDQRRNDGAISDQADGELGPAIEDVERTVEAYLEASESD